ncbi:MAG: thioredoxin family protein [Methanolobus sp.]
MNKIILPLLALIAILFVVAGYSGGDSGDTAITVVADAEQLNNAVAEGPVLVEIGTNNCPACTAQKPILAQIAKEYEGKASVLYINADMTRALATSFNIYSIPDMFVIVEETEEGYIYMTQAGETTTDRNTARFIGLTTKGTLTGTLDKAIEYRQ